MSRPQQRATIENHMQHPSRRTPTGLTDDEFIQAEKLSRAAANASLRARRGHLTEDQFDSLAVHLLGIGIAAWIAWDQDLAGGVSPETYAYRRMRGWRSGGTFTDGPYIDWLRTNIRDSRFDPDIITVLTTDGTIPDHPDPTHDDGTLELLITTLETNLGRSSGWALRQIAYRIAAHDLTLQEAATEAGVDEAFARVLMDTLADELRPIWNTNAGAEDDAIGLLEFAGLAA